MKKTTEPAEAEKTPIQKTKSQLVEDYLNLYYKFRFNTIKYKPEFIQYDTNFKKWQTLDEFKLLSIKRELDSAGLTITKQNLYEILFSDFGDYSFFHVDAERRIGVDVLCGGLQLRNAEQRSGVYCQGTVHCVLDMVAEFDM